MSALWYPNVKQSPLQGMNGMWGGVGSNLISGSSLAKGTIQEHYDAGSAPGIRTIVFDNSSEKDFNYTTYNSKGWIEIMFAANVPYGYDDTSGFYSENGGNYRFSSFNDSSGELVYTNAGSQVAMASPVCNTTDILFTSKSSKSLAQISPATGENESSILPLVASADLTGPQATAVKNAYLDYFRGGRDGFHHDGSGTGTNYFNAYWQKSPSPYTFSGLLHSRTGTAQLDHWMIADGQSNTPSTYYANIGFRGDSSTASFASKNVGSWTDSSTPKAADKLMADDNVFSVWVTDM